MSTPPPRLQAERALSMKEIMLLVGAYLQEVNKRLWLALLLGIVISLLNLVAKKDQRSTYMASLSFMLNDNEGSNAMGGINAVLGQFGLGGGAAAQPNLAKIVELVKSRKIIQRTLFEQVEIDGKKDYFANHFIRIYRLQDDWAGTELSGFVFKRDSAEAFSLLENKVLQDIAMGINSVLSTEIAESGIMYLSFTTQSEKFSWAFLNHLFENLSDYYVFQATESQRAYFNIVKARVDSLYGVINYREGSLAGYLDTNFKNEMRAYQVRSQRLSGEMTATIDVYKQAVANLEIARMGLDQSRPYVQPIDLPILPLMELPVGRTKSVLVGLVMGLFLVGGFVIARKFFTDLFNSTVDPSAPAA